MGADTIPERTPGSTIFTEWANVFRRVLSGNLLPRNSSGVVTDLAGSLGSTTQRWLNSYMQGLYLYNGVKRVLIRPVAGLLDDYDLVLPSLPTAKKVLTIDETGTLEYGTIDQRQMDLLPAVYSSDIASFITTSTSAVDVPGSSVSISIPAGKEVRLEVIAKSGGATGPQLTTTRGTSGNEAGGRLWIARVSTSDVLLAATHSRIIAVNTGDATGLVSQGSGYMTHYEAPGAGTFTYKLMLQSLGGSTQLFNARLRAQVV